MKACRITNDVVKTRLPIKKGLLGVILDKLNHLFSEQPYLCTLYRAIFAIAYYGLLRIGELVTGDHAIKVIDVHKGRNKEKMQIILRSSKTHSKADLPQVIKIESMVSKGIKSLVKLSDDTKHCPYKIIDQYLSRKPGFMKKGEPFFIFRDYTPVKPVHVRTALRQTLELCELNSALYDIHSFRIGQVTDLIKMGFSIDQVKLVGRWRSNAIYKYIREEIKLQNYACNYC